MSIKNNENKNSKSIDEKHYDKLLYCPNLFYSKIELDNLSKKEKKDFLKGFEYSENIDNFYKKKYMIHTFFMSGHISNYTKKTNKLFKKLYNFLNKNEMNKLILDFSFDRDIINKYFSYIFKINEKNKINKMNLDGGFFYKVERFNNHQYLCGNRDPSSININELTFSALMMIFSYELPYIFKSQKIIRIIDREYKKFILTKYKKSKRINYLKNICKIKNEILLEYKKIEKNKNYDQVVKKMICVPEKINIKSKYIQKILHFVDTANESYVNAYVFNENIIVSIRGTRTNKNIINNFKYLRMLISEIIQCFIKKNKITKEYKKILDKIEKEYGIYYYHYSFFISTLTIFYEIFKYICFNLENLKMKNIYVSGHSLGGAKSVLISIFIAVLRKMPEYKKLFKNVIVKNITFGEPSGIKKNEIGHKLVKKINSQIGYDYRYMRVLSFYKKDNAEIYKDFITTCSHHELLFIGENIPIKNIKKKDYNNIISPCTGEMLDIT